MSDRMAVWLKESVQVEVSTWAASLPQIELVTWSALAKISCVCALRTQLDCLLDLLFRLA